MNDNIDFSTLTEDQNAAVTAGGLLQIGILGQIIAAGISAAVTEIVKNWSDFTAGMSQGSAAAKSAR